LIRLIAGLQTRLITISFSAAVAILGIVTRGREHGGGSTTACIGLVGGFFNKSIPGGVSMVSPTFNGSTGGRFKSEHGGGATYSSSGSTGGWAINFFSF